MTAPRAKGFAFQVVAKAESGHARAAVLTTPHAEVETPTFMPVGTQGSVKGLTADEVAMTGAKIMLGNTYHLWLRPGPDVIARLGRLHGFTRWPHAMLTDSGGFQAFSLGGNIARPAPRPSAAQQGVSASASKDANAKPEKGTKLAVQKSLVTLDEEGFTFRSHLDGTRHHLSPEVAVRVQGLLGADIQMQLDVCPPGNSDRSIVEAAVSRTSRWARRALAVERPEGQALFGIVQGACFSDLRKSHAEELAALDPGFDGLALGGFSVGEPIQKMYETLKEVAFTLDPERPRYLMGVGTPRDLLEAIDSGIDMFDCVLPTRNARNGQALTRFGKVVIKQARYKDDPLPIDPECACPCCQGGHANGNRNGKGNGRGYARAYLRHLFLSGEMTVLRLLSLHNLWWYGELVQNARAAIRRGEWAKWKARTLDRIERGDE